MDGQNYSTMEEVSQNILTNPNWKKKKKCMESGSYLIVSSSSSGYEICMDVFDDMLEKYPTFTVSSVLVLLYRHKLTYLQNCGHGA